MTQLLRPVYNPSGNSFSGWIGGKHKLAKTIIEQMPEHAHYVEVFAGAAWVLFKKTPSQYETINDINGELVNFYRVVKFHFDALVIELQATPISRDWFNWLKAQDPATLTDLQRAVRFYYTLKLAFGNKVADQHYIPVSNNRTRLDIAKQVRTRLAAVHDRLQHVNIENLSYHELIPRYDRADVLFYLDPPYFATEDYYGKDFFSRDDFVRLRDLLLTLKGKFILSINDLPETRALFADFIITDRQIRWCLGKNQISNANNGKELIITNHG